MMCVSCTRLLVVLLRECTWTRVMALVLQRHGMAQPRIVAVFS